MNNSEIKICGLSTTQSIQSVIDGGANYIGFIFFEKSPRNISLELASELSNYAGNKIKKVSVSVNASEAFLDEIVGALKPDFIQLHGSETPKDCQNIKDKYNIPIIKAFAITGLEDLQKTEAYFECADKLLFDAKAPKGSNLPGGNGVSFDWNLLKEFKSPVPYMLSGGIDENNVIEALEISGAKAVDISSGVESAPGVKDIAKITRLIKTIRETKAG
ncbi:MAG: phosphoribosylanthranilate isomerase [Nitratireductor sp.]